MTTELSDADKLTEQMLDRLDANTLEFERWMINAAQFKVLPGWRFDSVEYIDTGRVKEIMVQLDEDGFAAKFYELRGHHILCQQPTGVLGVDMFPDAKR